MPTYQLINPSIEGTFETVVDAKQPLKAAEKIWINFTEHVADHVPNFMFTLKNISGGAYFHYKVNENKEKGTYVITQIQNMDNEEEKIEAFLKNVDAYNVKLQARARDDKGKQKGGAKKPHRKRYDDDSSSSSSDYVPLIKTSPITAFHYMSSLYSPVIVRPVVAVRSSTTLNPPDMVIQTPIFSPIFRTTSFPMVMLWNF